MSEPCSKRGGARFGRSTSTGKAPEIVSTAYAAGFDAGALFERRKREAATAD